MFDTLIMVCWLKPLHQVHRQRAGEFDPVFVAHWRSGRFEWVEAQTLGTLHASQRTLSGVDTLQTSMLPAWCKTLCVNGPVWYVRIFYRVTWRCMLWHAQQVAAQGSCSDYYWINRVWYQQESCVRLPNEMDVEITQERCSWWSRNIHWWTIGFNFNQNVENVLFGTDCWYSHGHG